MSEKRQYKIPESVLVLIHTRALDVLLLRRARMGTTCWQSVTGSRKTRDEPLRQTAIREVREETGMDATAPGACLSDWHMTNTFEIAREWGGHFAPGTTHNEEHVFGLCVPAATPVRLNADEHLEWAWLPWQEAAERCWSWTNAQACRELPARACGAVT
ncbi:MAG: dihydroneopterin triphosphate diphosphatase [Ottowia sp.]|nr:dihydroneopterin triphosphate diphosphatase [Ottowia sp.]